jgi:hypothetical protein
MVVHQQGFFLSQLEALLLLDIAYKWEETAKSIQSQQPIMSTQLA